MSRIVVNARFFTRRLTGVERYAREVSCYLNKLENNESNVVFLLPKGNLVDPPHSLKLVQDSSPLTSHLWEQLVLPQKLDKSDLLWSPTNTGPYTVQRQVLTLHDISPLEHPEWFTRSFHTVYSILLPRLVHRVRHILTNSMYSRQKILERFSLEPSKVTAIPLAPSPMFKPVQISERNHVLDRLGLNHPYILSLGSLEPRKNLLGLLKAWSFVQAKDVSLVISGDQGPAFADPQINSLLKHDSGVKFTGRLPDADLPSLYSGALAFVYPSFYEGFGLPPLEAMACGTPVIASGVTSLPEVCGDAALYCNPFNPEDIADKIHQLIIDSSLRNTLSSWGMEHAQHFSWVECARKTVAILKQFTY